ncbi:helicase domain protein, partial [mine drainage metagenome]
PLRFLLADDPGAGKTIMAGLFIKELMLRGDLRRCLVVAPGGLVAQWQDELSSKFSLQFSILTREAVEASLHGNPFAEEPLLIARMDQLSRSEDLQSRLRSSEWDLIIVDEAHRMSAHYQGDEVRETQRYRLGKLLGGSAVTSSCSPPPPIRARTRTSSSSYPCWTPTGSPAEEEAERGMSPTCSDG